MDNDIEDKGTGENENKSQPSIEDLELIEEMEPRPARPKLPTHDRPEKGRRARGIGVSLLPRWRQSC